MSVVARHGRSVNQTNCIVIALSFLCVIYLNFNIQLFGISGFQHKMFVECSTWISTYKVFGLLEFQQTVGKKMSIVVTSSRSVYQTVSS